MASSTLRRERFNACANGGSCNKPGTKACQSCHLVLYCSVACQKAHRREHSRDCKSPLRKETWKPDWVVQHRPPAFMGSEPFVKFGVHKYLWGNVPAVDFVKLADNEGVSFAGPLNLLFAASGDLRNVIVSVASLPAEYGGLVNIAINDMDLNVAARNVILLLLFLTVDSPREAAEHAIHIFYSALITQPCYDVLQTKIRPLIQDVCSSMAVVVEPADADADALQAKTWTFAGGRSSLCVALTRADWLGLLSFVDVPAGLTKTEAQNARIRVTAAPERVDYVHRHLAFQPPDLRPGIAKFRMDGLLLPFGSPRAAFAIPNPTIFQSADEWPMMDSADPLGGWPLQAVLDTPAGPATNDLYGKLYHHLMHLFATFHAELAARPVSFQLHRADARHLAAHITDMKFARVETSNIADHCYVGVGPLLEALAPLLQRPGENAHASLIMLFLNAVPEVIAALGDAKDGQNMVEDLNRVMKYMPINLTGNPYEIGVGSVKIISAMSMVKDFDTYFDMYMIREPCSLAVMKAEVDMKMTNTIVEPWPLRFHLGPPTAKAKRDFALLMASRNTGHERYMEWKATGGNGQRWWPGYVKEVCLRWCSDYLRRVFA